VAPVRNPYRRETTLDTVTLCYYINGTERRGPEQAIPYPPHNFKRRGQKMTDTLTKEERFIFDWQYRRLGGFKTALINVIKLADQGNRELLRRGFPDEVGAYEKFAHTPDWWDEVEAKGGFGWGSGFRDEVEAKGETR